jgi:hypothetical protein
VPAKRGLANRLNWEVKPLAEQRFQQFEGIFIATVETIEITGFLPEKQPQEYSPHVARRISNLFAADYAVNVRQALPLRAWQRNRRHKCARPQPRNSQSKNRGLDVPRSFLPA